MSVCCSLYHHLCDQCCALLFALALRVGDQLGVAAGTGIIKREARGAGLCRRSTGPAVRSAPRQQPASSSKVRAAHSGTTTPRRARCLASPYACFRDSETGRVQGG